MIKGDTVLDAFYDRLTSNAENLALKFGDTEISYQQLDELSNRVSHHLIAKGVSPETLVPICISNPLDMVIGIWGILKSGAAYVPIDSDFPADRIKYMITDSGANLVIADSTLSTFIAATEGKTVVLSDNNWDETKDSPATASPVKVSGNQVAYVIYTSGSTGQPKGVVLEHMSLLHYLKGLSNTLPFHTFKSYALGISLAADHVNTLLFSSLLSGGELHFF